MPNLWNLKKGQSRVIKGFSSELHESYVTRLKDLGFHPGESVVCVQAPALGAPKLFRINNAVYSLDDQVASEVFVEEVASGADEDEVNEGKS
jgi:Fe2+ transport system protein FeoA